MLTFTISKTPIIFLPCFQQHHLCFTQLAISPITICNNTCFHYANFNSTQIIVPHNVECQHIDTLSNVRISCIAQHYHVLLTDEISCDIPLTRLGLLVWGSMWSSCVLLDTFWSHCHMSSDFSSLGPTSSKKSLVYSAVQMYNNDLF